MREARSIPTDRQKVIDVYADKAAEVIAEQLTPISQSVAHITNSISDFAPKDNLEGLVKAVAAELETRAKNLQYAYDKHGQYTRSEMRAKFAALEKGIMDVLANELDDLHSLLETKEKEQKEEDENFRAAVSAEIAGIGEESKQKQSEIIELMKENNKKIFATIKEVSDQGRAVFEAAPVLLEKYVNKKLEGVIVSIQGLIEKASLLNSEEEVDKWGREMLAEADHREKALLEKLAALKSEEKSIVKQSREREAEIARIASETVAREMMPVKEENEAMRKTFAEVTRYLEKVSQEKTGLFSRGTSGKEIATNLLKYLSRLGGGNKQ